ncbi:GrpB family protein [Paenibacillus chitinolyticus]|uniref:GrpB family protein n=1 Tax=Paenibacillus chitinolyticus TaxID=79263 RepID=UPI0036DD2E45
MRKTIIAAWTERWAAMYSAEAKVIRRIFGNNVLHTYHIGSTSVPHIGYAKPIIDLLVVVRDINLVDSHADEMTQLGYAFRGESGIKGRRYFTKGGYNRTHHVHTYAAGNVNIKMHLDFKEYLLTHPEEAKKYGELKVSLAKKFPDDTYKYQEGKESFVSELMASATEWASKRPNN